MTGTADRGARQTNPGDPMHRETAGEYMPVIFLRAGGLGVVTTIQKSLREAFGI